MLFSKKNKFFFLLNFRVIFFNYKLLCFCESGVNNKSLKYISINSNIINSIFNTNNKLFYFIKNKSVLFYTNDFIELSDLLKSPNVFTLSVSNYFVDSSKLSFLSYYYMYYNNNYSILIDLIYIFIRRYLFFIYIFVIKIVLVLNIFLCQINKKN